VSTVGVIVPCFNGERYVAEAVSSALRQKGVELLLVAVDDGSTDASLRILELEARADPRLTVETQPNAGSAAARIRGLHALPAAVDYLLFLDADDVLEPGMLRALANELDTHPEVGAAFCGLRLIGADGQPLATELPWTPRLRPAGRSGLVELGASEPETSFFAVLAGCPMIPSVTLIRRSLYDASPGWDPAFGQPYEDMNLFLELALRAPLHHLPRTLVAHRRHPAQSTASRQRTAEQEAKLYARWRDLDRLAPPERAVVKAAFEAFDHRLVPRLGWAAARVRLRSGDVRGAARFGLGALRRRLRGVASQFLAQP
jgi:glycosyltransferase involved in cell wall biosynthesis